MLLLKACFYNVLGNTCNLAVCAQCSLMGDHLSLNIIFYICFNNRCLCNNDQFSFTDKTTFKNTTIEIVLETLP